MQERVNYMMENQELILDAPTQESTIQELEIQVSFIQESKMQKLIIQMVQESHEVLRIQRQSKVQTTNENSKTI